MADVVETCSRCGKLIEGGPALVVVQSGPRAPAQPVINLCPHCADSMSRWLARCATTPGSRSPRPDPSNDRPTRRIAIAITTTISFASGGGGGGGEGG